MPTQIVCPNPDCGASYSVVDANLGNLGRCKKCGETFPLVPDTRDGGPPSVSQTDLDSVPKPRSEPVLPESFGRYKILRLLGRGGMGSVYLALDPQLKRQVALKVPHINAFADKPEIRVRFLREAEAAARFQHPNFCPIFDIGDADGVPFLTMAFIEGKTISASIEWGEGWPLRKAVEVVRQLAVALAVLHRQGIVHRDLKPANIMVEAQGNLILMDFGLARWYDELDSTFTPTGAILGTPAYMPPEQAEGNLKAIGPRSDLYSLGVILYELLTGRRPFEGPITKVLGMISFAAPPLPSSHCPGLDPALEIICLKAMAKKPENRYASMDEFAVALRGWLEDGPPLECGSLLPHATRAGGRPRFPIRARVAAALAVAALVFGIIYVATDKGRIKIEVNDPNAVVFVDGKDVRIEGVGEPITLRAGEHSLTIKRGEVEVKAETFVVRRGDNEPLRITLEAPAREKLPEQPMPLAVASGDPPTLAKPVEAPKPSPPPAPKMEAVDTPPLKLAEAPKPSPPPAPKTEAVDTPPLKLDDALITNTLGMKLKLIPAGEFDMGSDATDPDAEGDEKFKGKKHHVRITEAFYLGTTEVTVGQFRQFVEKANYEGDPKSTRRSPGFPQTDEYPVVNVSHYDAVAFCDWLSREEGKTYRLPTEAEWEYGCRAGQATRYSSGDDEKSLAAVGHFKAGGTVAVGSLRPNAFGLYDMHGNVLEWCADWYDRDYYSKSPPTDPLNSSQAPRRVSRGGSWYTVGGYCRSAFRDSRDPSYRHYYLGFRVARVRSE